ncbi:AEC family transporter [Clostridium sp. LY3-2]|uniref:AEC family transporter n=1 Tax=Clostridium sp. LY3-2 TaxID=2942482 RepID=UPI0021535750|nr:AEC family transporter [Clostridium sp. LY3-2]MCR6515617.1 AEC family transporter [Clostridium sp. LY3-2]
MDKTIINQVIILFLIMLVGIFCRKKNILTEESTTSLSNLMLNITLPSLIISSFNYTVSKELEYNCLRIFIYASIIHIFLILISKILCFKEDSDTSIILRSSYIFSNAGFMGYPLMAGIYGKVGVLYTAIFGIPYNIILFTFGSFLFSKKSFKSSKTEVFKTILLNPGIIATLLGIVLMLFNLKLPDPLFKAISDIGDMTTPLAMIIVGGMLSTVNFKDIFKDKKMYLISFIKLILIPILVYLVVTILGETKELRTICVLLEATPAAVVVSIFAKRYNIKEDLAAKVSFITTLLSLFTIPLIMSIL